MCRYHWRMDSTNVQDALQAGQCRAREAPKDLIATMRGDRDPGGLQQRLPLLERFPVEAKRRSPLLHRRRFPHRLEVEIQWIRRQGRRYRRDTGNVKESAILK